VDATQIVQSFQKPDPKPPQIPQRAVARNHVGARLERALAFLVRVQRIGIEPEYAADFPDFPASARRNIYPGTGIGPGHLQEDRRAGMAANPGRVEPAKGSTFYFSILNIPKMERFMKQPKPAPSKSAGGAAPATSSHRRRPSRRPRYASPEHRRRRRAAMEFLHRQGPSHQAPAAGFNHAGPESSAQDGRRVLAELEGGRPFKMIPVVVLTHPAPGGRDARYSSTPTVTSPSRFDSAVF